MQNQEIRSSIFPQQIQHATFGSSFIAETQ